MTSSDLVFCPTNVVNSTSDVVFETSDVEVPLTGVVVASKVVVVTSISVAFVSAAVVLSSAAVVVLSTAAVIESTGKVVASTASFFSAVDRLSTVVTSGALSLLSDPGKRDEISKVVLSSLKVVSSTFNPDASVVLRVVSGGGSLPSKSCKSPSSSSSLLMS